MKKEKTIKEMDEQDDKYSCEQFSDNEIDDYDDRELEPFTDHRGVRYF